MSVNRRSDLDTSLSRTDGVHHKYLNLSSSDRNKTLFPDSADAEITFDDQSSVLGMKILNFEIPHTRYAIDQTCNSLYISEKWGDDDYNFYCLRASTGGYSVQNLCATLTLSSQGPKLYNGDRGMGNEYTFHTNLLFGKVGISSSGDYEYTVHAANKTVTLSSIVLNSDTEAVVSFVAPSDHVFKPGALLVFQPYTYADRDVQVVETMGEDVANQVRVIGDFSDIDAELLDVSLSRMVPYSATNSVARILGFGEADLSGQSDFEILSIGSPFYGNDNMNVASVMVTTNFTPFLAPGDYVRLQNIPGFMTDMVCEVDVVHDDTHLEISIDRSILWRHDEGKIANIVDPTVQWGVEAIDLSNVDNNSIQLTLQLDTAPAPTALYALDEAVFSGFYAEELADLSATVLSVDEKVVVVEFNYPATFLFDDGVSSLCPTNPITLVRTTYMAPHRFDLSRGRRMVLCRAVVDNQDVGSIHIPSLSTRSFFGRIQLFSGGDLVNFLSKDTAVGSHEFNSVLKRLNKIKFQFFNEDGTKYDFVGVDYTMFLELTCLDSNRGL